MAIDTDRLVTIAHELQSLDQRRDKLLADPSSFMVIQGLRCQRQSCTVTDGAGLGKCLGHE